MLAASNAIEDSEDTGATGMLCCHASHASSSRSRSRGEGHVVVEEVPPLRCRLLEGRERLGVRGAAEVVDGVAELEAQLRDLHHPHTRHPLALVDAADVAASADADRPWSPQPPDARILWRSEAIDREEEALNDREHAVLADPARPPRLPSRRDWPGDGILVDEGGVVDVHLAEAPIEGPALVWWRIGREVLRALRVVGVALHEETRSVPDVGVECSLRALHHILQLRRKGLGETLPLRCRAVRSCWPRPWLR